MTRRDIGPITVDHLRGALLFALDSTRPLEKAPCSLWLLVLGSVYLAAPTSAEPALGHEFFLAADTEGVDADEILTALLLIDGVTS